MKNILFLMALLFLANCTTNKIVLAPYKPVYESFEIQKILESGLQKVEIKKTEQEWPEVILKSDAPLKLNSKKIKLAVIGDTGCRLLEAPHKSSYQNCSSSEEWPYPQVVKSVVKEKYDFVIHTGDYHYREHCTDKKICPEYTKSIGYGWSAWWDDFYGPSQELFKKSPILFVRGNHEDCNRAFNGWGPLSVRPKAFELKCEEECTEVEPYQWIDLGDLVLINFDDSAFQDRAPSLPNVRNNWLKLLTEISNRISALPKEKEIWFLSHKPIIGFVPDKNKEPKLIGDYLHELIMESGLVKKIDYFLSGHIHNQQLAFGKNDLLQLIIGHSGSALDPFGSKVSNEKIISTTDSKLSFGYALFERKAFKHWGLTYKDVRGKTVLHCDMKSKKVNCK